MSRGPLPAEIYWRRRFLLLAVLLLIAYAVVTLWPDGSDAGTSAAQPTATPSATSSADPADETSEDAAAEEEQTGPSTRDTTVSLAAGGPPCDAESIRITPHVAPDQTVRQKVRLQLALATTAEEPCTFRPRADDLVAVVSTGGNAVWDSQVCSDTALVEGAVALSPQWSTVVDATWSGRGSGPACSDDEGWVSPGKYALRIGTLGGEPGTTTFRLAAEAKPDPDDEPPADSDDTSDEASADDSPPS